MSSYILRRQWRIATARHPDLAWPTLIMPNNLVLQYHPDTRIDVAQLDDAMVVLIGLGLDEETGCIATADELLSDDVALFSKRALTLAGTYVAILATSQACHVATDPAGMLPVYYQKKTREMASSPALLSPLVKKKQLDGSFRFGGTNDWYPGVITPFADIETLPANHIFEYFEGKSNRLWPLADPEPRSYEIGVRQLAETIRNFVESLAGENDVLLSLTGGYDSRINFAAARNVIDKCHIFTIDTPNTKPCDRAIPRQLAEVASCQYHCYQSRQSPEDQLRLYDQITGGMAIGDRREILDACQEASKHGSVHLNGNLGALAKGFYWRGNNPKRFRPSAVLRDFQGVPDAFQVSVANWAAGVPGLKATTLYNLFYLEQRGGKWMAPGETGSQLYYDSVTPFGSRRVFEIISALPTQKQCDGELLRDLVEVLWPELLQIPYCRGRRRWSKLLPPKVRSIARRLR